VQTLATESINTAWDEDSAAESTMRRWFAKFRCRYFNLEDEEGCGWDYSVDDDKLKTLVKSNPQTTLRDLCAQIIVFISTISTHFSEIGKMKKLNRFIERKRKGKAI